MYEYKYFKVKSPIETRRGWISEGVILYCYNSSDNNYYFKDIVTASLAVILRETQINYYLKTINNVNKLELFRIHSKDILNGVLPMYDFLPTEAKYVVDNLEQGYIYKAYTALERHIDVIKHSFFCEELESYCISL